MLSERQLMLQRLEFDVQPIIFNFLDRCLGLQTLFRTQALRQLFVQ